jgi:3',5'-cyclic AMP phosphodiesterase CpdA
MKPRKARRLQGRKFTCYTVLLAMLFSLISSVIPVPVYAGTGPKDSPGVSSAVRTVTVGSAIQPANGDYFTIAVLPDTQFYAESYPEIFKGQTQWLAEQAQVQNIVFVAHLGDIQDDFDEPAQWRNAQEAMAAIREAGIPYSLVPGNHDLNFKIGDTTQFDKYFPYTDFTGFSWYGGHYPEYSNTSSYQLFSALGQDFIVLNLVCTPVLLAEATDWANGVLSQYSNRKAIVVTHGYIKPNGDYAGGDSVSGIAIRNNIVKKHSNVIAVLCGHIDGQYHGTDTGDSGNTIYNLLTDYTDQPNGGNGWLRLYQFYPSANILQAVTYSPYLEQYDTSAAGQFRLPLEERFAVTADSSISGGAVTVNPAGGIAGDTITVIVTPAEGKQLVPGSLKYNDGTVEGEITATGGLYSFVLPAADVTVTARFEDLSDLTINTREELIAFAAAVNSGDSFEGRIVVLGGDIALDADGLYAAAEEYFQDGIPDYSGTFTVPTISAAAEIWTPIGTNTNPFKGVFDGGGHTVSGLYTDVNASYQGLFGYIGPGGSVKDITVSGVVAGVQYVGGIAGFINSGVIENAANRAVIYASGGAEAGGSGTGKSGHAGGIVGMGTGTASAPVSITGCANYGTVTAPNCNQGGRAGGIAGIFDQSGDYATIAGCFNTAEIKGYQYVGGIVGGQFANNVTISACYNTGAVAGASSGKTYAGGIAGKSCGPLTDCYNTGNIVSTRFAGIAGETESAGAGITNCYSIGQVLYAAAPIGTSGNIVGSQAVSPINCYYLDAAALGTAFAFDSSGFNDGYPVLAWQNGPIPEPVPHAVTLSFDATAATVSASAPEAAPGETVTIAITGLAAGKRVQSVSAIDANSVSYPVATVAENASYTFTMGSSAVTVTVLFENTSGGGEPYAYSIEPGIDPIWTMGVTSSGLENGAIAAGSTVTVTVNRMAGAITASLEGITVRNAGGEAVAVETISTASGGYNTISGGVYTFIMPESAATIELNAVYAGLSVYTQTGENGTPTLVKTYSREEMSTLASGQTIYYTGYDRYPTAVIGKAAQVVKLTDLLDNAGVSLGAGGILKLNALDESTRTYTYAALYGENRYYYPNIAAAENKDAGKAPVDAMLVIKGYQERFFEFEPGQGIDDMVCDTLNAYRFVYGQTETQFNGGVPLSENATVGDFLKYTCAVTIITPETDNPQYTVAPVADEAVYEVGETDGIATMTVKETVGGLKYFAAQITPLVEHEGKEAVVFVHLHGGLQQSLNITRGDFDLLSVAQAGFNVQAGDVIKVYIVDDLTNDVDHNPLLLQ